MFETDSWKEFNNEFNMIAGGYRYRWGDCEILGIYGYIHLDPPIINFDLKSKGLYENQLPSTKLVLSIREEIIQIVKNIIKSILKNIKAIFD